MKELDEMIDEIKSAYNIARKEKCEKCRYRKFSEEMNKLNYSSDMLEELKQEMIEQHDYEKNKWTKIFKPAIFYIGFPAIASYITSWCYDHTKGLEDFWLGLIFIVIVFFIAYLSIGSIVSSILLNIDVRRNRYSMASRFLQKYIQEKRLAIP